MPKDPSKKPMADGAKYTLIGTIITAIIGLVGTAITLYIQNVYPLKLADRNTQTAEARPSSAVPSVAPSLTPVPDTLTPSLVPATATYTPTITSTPVTATLTPSLTPTLTSTLAPTFTPSPTATATIAVDGMIYCVDTHMLNVRAGPGVNFNIIGVLPKDECIYFDGYVVFDGLYSWVRISDGQARYPEYGNAWVYGSFLRPQDFERLQLLTLPPPPVYSPTPEG